MEFSSSGCLCLRSGLHRRQAFAHRPYSRKFSLVTRQDHELQLQESLCENLSIQSYGKTRETLSSYQKITM